MHKDKKNEVTNELKEKDRHKKGIIENRNYRMENQ